MGSRNLEKGQKSLDELISSKPECSGKIELIQIDTSCEKSIIAARDSIKEKLGEEKLYAIVNNAGTGLAHKMEVKNKSGQKYLAPTTADVIVKTNLYGPYYMNKNF
jgi:NAD(P)-dependent dehydrogenase (short-subunit alcohol dehydrogenase family)